MVHSSHPKWFTVVIQVLSAQSAVLPAQTLAQNCPTTESHPQYFIEAPPAVKYPSEQAAEAAIHAWTKAHNVNVSRQKPAKNEHGEVRYRLFACDHAEKPKNTRKLQDSDRKRIMVSSKRTGCKMRVSIIAVDANNTLGPWKIAYTKDGSQLHNHPPSSDVRVHVAHRQRDARQTQSSTMTTDDLIEVQAKAGVSTSRIYATAVLRDKDTLVLQRDIANKKKPSRIKLLSTLTSSEALFQLLKDNEFHFAHEVDTSTNRLRYLMWVHPATTKLARHFMDILVIDCTYKTNKYRMPLLNVITLTGMNTILPFAQIWMPGEAEPDFSWALSKVKELMEEQAMPMPKVIVTDRDLACTNATEKVSPLPDKLLCRWHIRRNVLAQAKRKIKAQDVPGASALVMKNMTDLRIATFMAKYDDTINSVAETEFEERCSELRTLSLDMDSYLKKHWWPHKKKFVHCWTNGYQHFGCYDTSTVEGTHATMKGWIDSSKGDLVTVFQKLLPWWVQCATNNQVQVATETSEIPHLLRGDDYSAVVKIISVRALTKTNEVWKKAHRIVVHGIERDVCDGVYRRIHGRPCAHGLIEIVESAGVLKLMPEHFDKHWWLPVASSEASSRVLEPDPLQKKRRTQEQVRSHKAGHGITSTRREPSGFELVEQTGSSLSFQELLEQNDEDFQTAFVPPRSWSYAGLRDLDG